MNGSTGNAAFNAYERPNRREVALNLVTARRMLPLVQRIVADLLACHQAIARLQPEIGRLDRQRHDLRWPERQRRYAVREEMNTADRKLQEALDELDELGLAVLDGDVGRIGFPTIVNDRRAYFSWRMGEEGLRSWHFAEEVVLRPIPPAWHKAGDISLSGKIG